MILFFKYEMSNNSIDINMDRELSQYGVPEFDELTTATKTIMVYTNMYFNIQKLFENIPITHIDINAVMTDKGKLDKTKISAPYGSIISLQKENEYRGLKTAKTKKKKSEPARRINYFRNQMTIIMSLGHINLNIMFFIDSFKIAGCKTEDDAVEATRILWEDYISQIPNSTNIGEIPSYTKDIETESVSSQGSASKNMDFKDNTYLYKNNESIPKFLFELVMRNVGVNLNFNINRSALNYLMNQPEYQDKVFVSQYEGVENTSVNIKMYSHKPTNYQYDVLIIPPNTEAYFERSKTNPWKKKYKKEYMTLIVFSSSATIISGKYYENMKESYEFFIKEIFKNREIVEEKLRVCAPDIQKHESFMKEMCGVGVERI